ncbi:MAG: dTDP-4-dehydrorhamnose 3,5-epimerase [Acidobacteriota bacterium]|nr:dTDP-4-dehydrorhamnose 3,5-epimerase [Acidobacteriota bacterium]
MEVIPLKLKGSYEIRLAPRGDERGYFMRTYDREIFRANGLQTEWMQENQSLSTQLNTIRGLHFLLPPHTETKLVRTVQGKILDVFVDLRRESETFGQWDSIELSEENHRAVYIPKGFAHGFCTLTERAVVQYKVDSLYVGEADAGIRWNDSAIGIKWNARNPILSERDKNLPLLAEFDSPF